MSRSNWTDDKLLSRLTNNKSSKSRWDNIKVLRKRPSEELFFKCVEFTKSKNPNVRSIGIDILAQMGVTPRPFGKQSLKLYFNLLNVENNTEVLMSLLFAIGHNNDNLSKVQINKLCSFIDNENILVKEGLVFSLLSLDNFKAIETLIKLSEDKQSHIRNWATFGLGTQIEVDNNKIREALWKRVTDKHQETKLEAIVGLAKRKDRFINEIIKNELREGEYGTLLLEAILEIGEKEFLPLLKQNLKIIKKDKNTNPEWLKDLKSCIDELTKLTNDTRRTTA